MTNAKHTESREEGDRPQDQDAQRTSMEERLQRAFGRLGKALALLHSDEEGERNAALRACLKNFSQINALSEALNPDSPLVLSFPELLRLADSGGGNTEDLSKIEELSQANAALKASETLLLQDRRRLEILLTHAHKGDEKFLAEQKKVLREILASAGQTISEFPQALTELSTSLTAVVEQASSSAEKTAPQIPDVYEAWIKAARATHLPLEAVLEEKTLSWWQRTLLRSAGLPIGAGDIVLMKAMIEAQDTALRQRAAGTTTGVENVAAQLARLCGVMSDFQSTLAAAESRIAPPMNDHQTADQAELLKHLASLQTELTMQKEALEKVMEEKAGALREKEALAFLQKEENKKHAAECDALKRKMEEHRLTQRRHTATKTALRYRNTSHQRGRVLEEIKTWLTGVLTPEALDQLFTDSPDERSRADMAAIQQQGLSSQDLSHLIVRGFLLQALEKKLRAVIADQRRSQKESEAWKDLATQFARNDTFNDRFFATFIGVTSASFLGIFGVTSLGALARNPTSFLGFVGTSAAVGGLASGFYHALKTSFTLENISAVQRKGIRHSPLVRRAFSNGLLPGALAGVFAGLALTIVTEPKEPISPQPTTKTAVASTSAASSAPPPAANTNVSSSGSPPASKSTTILIVPHDFAEAAKQAAELCAAQSKTGKPITCLSANEIGTVPALK